MPFASRRLSLAVLVTLSAATPLLSGAAEDAQDAAERKAAGAVFTAYNKMLSSKFAVDVHTTDDKGNKSQALAEYEGLSRIHVKTDQMEVVSTPEGTWVHAGEQGWQQPPADMAAMVKQFVPKSAAELQASSKNVKDEGVTSWNGQPAHAYSYDVDTQVMGADVKSHNKVIINAAGQLVRSESDGEAMGMKSHSVQDIRYDENLKVVPPQG
jgi:hypothetical protein